MSKLKTLEELAEQFREYSDGFSFGGMLQGIREIMGLKMKRVCELVNIRHVRLKALESDSFNRVPTQKELAAFAALFGYEEDYLYAKAKEQVALNKGGSTSDRISEIKNLIEKQRFKLEKRRAGK